MVWAGVALSSANCSSWTVIVDVFDFARKRARLKNPPFIRYRRLMPGLGGTSFSIAATNNEKQLGARTQGLKECLSNSTNHVIMETTNQGDEVFWTSKTSKHSPHDRARNFVKGFLEVSENEHEWLLLFLTLFLELPSTEDHVYSTASWSKVTLWPRKYILSQCEKSMQENASKDFACNAQEWDAAVVTAVLSISLLKDCD